MFSSDWILFWHQHRQRPDIDEAVPRAVKALANLSEAFRDFGVSASEAAERLRANSDREIERREAEFLADDGDPTWNSLQNHLDDFHEDDDDSILESRFID